MKYKTNYNDINIKQLDVIKKYIVKHVKEEETNVKESRDKYYKLLKNKSIPNKNKDFPNTIYANKYFYDKSIIDLYGEYPLRNNLFDSVENRMIWIDHHTDFGNYYYNFVISNMNIYNKKEIQESIKTVTNYHDLADKVYNKEKKVDKYFNKCSKFVKEYKNLDDLGLDDKKYDNGDYSIVTSKKEDNINIKLDKALIYRWSKDKWEYIEEAEGDSLLYLCGLEGDKIKDITSINCVYTLDGCKSKRLYKFEKQIDMTDDAKNNYKELLEDINTMDQTLKEKMLEAKIELSHRDVSKIVIEAKEPKFLEDKISIAVMQILSRITKVKNPYARRHLLYQLLEKDGLEIGDMIYSKKYQGFLLCGHYIYLKREDYTNDNTIKQIVRDKLLTRFGDDGKSIPGQQSCKVCGTYLGSVPYDDSPSFDDQGVPIIVRDEWVDEDKMILQAQQKQGEIVICKSQSFRNDMISKGFKLEQLEDGIKICEALQSISKKIGIHLLKSDFINITADILEQFTLLPLYNLFRKKSILLSKTKGVSTDKILKLDKLGIYKITYSKFRLLRKYTLIVARLLISIQTSVPPYNKSKSLTGCTFATWQGKYGIEYLSCILQEMKVLTYKDVNDKQRFISLEEIIDDTFKSIRTFNEKVTIKKLYSKRFIYDKSKPAQSIKKIDASSKPNEVEPLDKNFRQKVLTTDDVKMLQDELYARMRYLTYSIKSLISEVISKQELILELTLRENSCCIQKIDNYIYPEFIDYNTDNGLKRLINNTWDIIFYFDLFLNRGSVTKLFVNPGRIVYTHNRAVQGLITLELIRKKFETYCHIGSTRGELHYFIGDGKEERCVKCGEYLENIEKTEYSKEEFDKLLDEIVKRNYFNLEFKDIKSLLNLDELKKEDISSEINNFVERLSKIVGKVNDKIFKDRYRRLLNELGNYDNIYEIPEDVDNYNLIRLINNKEENRVQLLKIYINQYFRRFISIITNNFNVREFTIKIPTLTSALSQELQKFIGEDYDRLGQYFTESNVEIFKNLKFNYSIKEVDSIYGKSDRYNCDWDKIVGNSKFNLKNATDVLLYILVSELNKFLLEDDSVSIANFIVSMFDIIIDDNNIYDMSNKEVDKYRTTVYHDEYCKYSRELATDGSVGDTTFLKDQFGLVSDGVVDIQGLMEQQSQLVEDNFKRELQDVEVENLAKQKIGTDATPEQLEAFKETFYKNRSQEMYIYTDQFNMQQPKEDQFEILEVGDNYGLMQQGTENEGDGISVYSQSEWGE